MHERKNDGILGTLKIIQLTMVQYPEPQKRNIRVWLPVGYNQDNSQNRYPVLYMHDGQNLFEEKTSYAGEWEIDETITTLVAQGEKGTIVVGIDNSADRMNELSPNWPRVWGARKMILQPSGEKYADFIVNTVKPYIDAHFHTLADCDHTGIGGSSMGGVISLYMVLTYFEVFSYGLLFSTAAQIYKWSVIQDFVKNQLEQQTKFPRLFLYAGGLEHSITPYVHKIKSLLIHSGYPQEKIQTLIDSRAKHNEQAWAKHFPAAYLWLTKK